MLISTKKRYSQEEDQVILEELKKSPTNILKAFDRASERLTNRSSKAISLRWYTTLRAKHPYIITTGSTSGFSNNVKNDSKGTHNLKPFQVIVKHMLDLSDTDRQMILNFFK